MDLYQLEVEVEVYSSEVRCDVADGEARNSYGRDSTQTSLAALVSQFYPFETYISVARHESKIDLENNCHVPALFRIIIKALEAC